MSILIKKNNEIKIVDGGGRKDPDPMICGLTDLVETTDKFHIL